MLGFSFALAIGMGNVIGAGIMRTPGGVVDNIPSMPIVMGLWLLGGLHCLLLANIASELITAIPKVGGNYVPVRFVFGDSLGLLAGWADWLSAIASVAALGVVCANFTAVLIPPLGAYTPLVAMAFGAMSFAVNFWGVRESAAAEIGGSLLKFLFLCAIVVAIFVYPPLSLEIQSSPNQAGGESTFGLFGILIAYQLIYGAYGGWSGSTYFVEEDSHAIRHLPRAMFMTVGSIMVVYLLLNAGLFHALPIDVLRQSDLPVSVAMANIFGPIGGKIVAACAILLAANCLHGNLMVAPRILYGMGRDGLFPLIATRVNKHGTPDVALAISGLFAAVLILSGGFEFLFRLMGALIIFTFVLYEASLFGLRIKHPNLPRPYRAKLYPALPILVTLVDVALLVLYISTDLFSGGVMLGLIALCVPIGHYLSRERQRARAA
ncbi:APC family permease [Altererythrobacter sp.]|uniref:APC family permease n=1 Tax=Altererythrobacter sp. TaxID=1872480 RepID=UPI003D00548D